MGVREEPGDGWIWSTARGRRVLVEKGLGCISGKGMNLFLTGWYGTNLICEDPYWGADT